MKKRYKHLTQDQRCQIEEELSKRDESGKPLSLRRVGRNLNLDPSTVSREPARRTLGESASASAVRALPAPPD